MAPAQAWTSAARDIGATVLEMVQTRLELAATELEEERLRLARQALCIAAAAVFAALGMACAALAFVLLAPPAERPGRLAWLAGAFLAAAAAAAFAWHRRSSARPALLACTLDELRKDCAGLRLRGPG
jgi:uncharacterized membrane protein YqjE